MPPCIRPSCHISRLRQSGHQRAGADVRDRGASLRQSAISSAVAATGTDQKTKLAGQPPPTSGKTSGIVSAAGNASPISKPLA